MKTNLDCIELISEDINHKTAQKKNKIKIRKKYKTIIKDKCRLHRTNYRKHKPKNCTDITEKNRKVVQHLKIKVNKHTTEQTCKLFCDS